MNAQQRAAKRHKRENRPGKSATWRCACGGRHPFGRRCPIAVVDPFALPFTGLELAAIGALEAAARGRQ